MSSSEATSESPAPKPEPENDNDSELVDRIRRTALGQSMDERSQRNAQLAFDTNLDLETRMRMIAKLSALDPPDTRPKKKGRWSWMQIPVGILLVFGLGAGLTRRAAPPKAASELAPSSATELSAAKPDSATESGDSPSPLSATAADERQALPGQSEEPLDPKELTP